MIINLNEIQAPCEDNAGVPFPITMSSADGVTFITRGLKSALLELIKESHTVLGAVAWLTDFDILDALVGREVRMLVQKEDFLRPDLGSDSNFKRQLRQKYNALTQHASGLNGELGLNYCAAEGSVGQGAVRCIGNHNADRAPAFPRMHDKLAIFYRRNAPAVVWTGSFNWTANAGRSIENAVILSHPHHVAHARSEWEHLFSISEELDWRSEWCAPEMRYGT